MLRRETELGWGGGEGGSCRGRRTGRKEDWEGVLGEAWAKYPGSTGAELGGKDRKGERDGRIRY